MTTKEKQDSLAVMCFERGIISKDTAKAVQRAQASQELIEALFDAIESQFAQADTFVRKMANYYAK